MPGQKSSGKPTTKRYSPEQKERAVRLVKTLRAETGEKHGSVKRIADQLDIGVESLRTWVRQDEIDNGERAGTTTADASSRRFEGLLAPPHRSNLLDPPERRGS